MRLRRITFEPVDWCGLGLPAINPVLGHVLQRDKELLRPLHRLGVKFVPAFELALE